MILQHRVTLPRRGSGQSKKSILIPVKNFLIFEKVDDLEISELWVLNVLWQQVYPKELGFHFFASQQEMLIWQTFVALDLDES